MGSLESITGAYEQRSPRQSHYFQCAEAHFEELEMAWDDRYQRKCGFLRPYVMDVIKQYLDCGDPKNGFARIRCPDCHHEYLLPFSCKRRHFCPCCHQKRVIVFGEELCEDVLKSVPHRHWVFSIPKRLRIYFLFDRKLLSKLSRCAWNVLKRYLKSSVYDDDSVPGAVVAMQTFGDFLDFHPHLHIIGTDGCFSKDGAFMVSPRPRAKDLENVFRKKVFGMLKKEGKITDAIIENMMGWHHSGFNIYCGPAIWPHDEAGLENLARYIIRASFSQERMTYIPTDTSNDGTAKVLYRSKDGSQHKTFDALDWLALLTTHIPDRYEQTVRYYGYYSNRARGDRKKSGRDEVIPMLMDAEVTGKQFKRNWARLIKKIYNVDPLICPKCQSQMKIISVIEDDVVIKKILMHLGLWDVKGHDPPARSSPVRELIYDHTYSQLPAADYWME